MIDCKAFYSTKFNNFKAFIKSQTSPAITKMFGKYLTLPFDAFMFGLVQKLVVPNIAQLDMLIEQKLLEAEVSAEEVGIDNIDKFKRYLELFATYFE